VRLPVSLPRLIPHHLPLTHGRLHFLRKVDGQGHVHVLNEPRVVGRTWMGEYVRVGVDTAQQTLTIWHQPETHAPWLHLKTSPYRFYEPGHPLLPECRRNRSRCCEHWPS
jgi:hypothetical protein